MKRILQSLLVAPAIVAIAATSATIHAADIVDTAVSAGQFNTLVTAVKAAGLVDTLKGKGPFTVFAPTDDAFSKLPAGTLKNLLNKDNQATLASILTYHVVPGRVLAKQAFTADSAPTVNGQQLLIRRSGGRLLINDSLVITTDIECSNGVIHVIDTVLMPETKTIPEVAEAAGTFSTLLAAVKTADLADTLSGEGPFTVLAPTDEAFAALPEGTVESLLKEENRDQLIRILTYHVISGRVYARDAVEAETATTLQGQSVQVSVSGPGVKIDKAGLVQTDIEAANGVIHVIDQVLMPTSLTAAETRERLENAVSRGARAFNRGDVHECCELYESACREIVEAGDDLPESVRAVLQAALSRAANVKHEGERAWVLRHGIDLAYYSLH